MTNPRILIACIGNIFLGDDGFGTEVARRLAGRPLPPGVILKDFGIRGLDLDLCAARSVRAGHPGGRMPAGRRTGHGISDRTGPVECDTREIAPPWKRTA